jgi:hypothetical protein
MATFSQFKSKYIIEKREPLRGDSLDKNIIKKLVTDPIEKNKEKLKKIDNRIKSDLNIPDDGGKAGQARIEKELGLNDKNKAFNQEISRRRSAETTRGDAINRSLGTSGSTEGAGGANTGTKPRFSSGAQGTSPSGSPEMGGESKKFVQNRRRRFQTRVLRPKPEYDLTGNKIDDSVKSVRANRRTINKVYEPNVTRTRGSGITVNKGSGATASTSPDLNKIVNRKSNNIIDKVFGSGDTKITTSKIPGEGSKIFQQNKISNTISGKTKVDLPKFSQQSIDKAKGSSNTFIKPETVNQVKTTQQPLKGFKQFRADSVTRQGTKNVVKGLAGKASKALGIAGLALDAGVTFRDTYKRSQAQGHSKQRSIGKSLAKIGGGIVGGALGGTIGSAAGPAGSFVGAGVGYAGGKEFGARAFDKLTTQQGRDELKQSFKNFRKRAMKPVGT